MTPITKRKWIRLHNLTPCSPLSRHTGLGVVFGGQQSQRVEMVNAQCGKVAHWLQNCRMSNSSNQWIEGCNFLFNLRNHNTQNDLGNSVISGTAWFGCVSVRVQASGWVRGKHICAALRVSGDRVPEAATIGLLQKIQERIRRVHEVRLSKRNKHCF